MRHANAVNTELESVHRATNDKWQPSRLYYVYWQ